MSGTMSTNSEATANTSSVQANIEELNKTIDNVNDLAATVDTGDTSINRTTETLFREVIDRL